MRAKRAEASRERWVWLSLLPFGLGSWAPIIAGIRHRVKWWTAVGVFWAAVTVLALILSGSEREGHNALAGGLTLLAWAGGIVSSFVIRSSSRRLTGPALFATAAADPDLAAAESHARAHTAAPIRRDRWPWVSVLPLGLGSWTPIIAAVRCRVWWWALPGVAGGAATIAGFALVSSASSPGGGTHQTESVLAALLLIAAWVGGIGGSFAIRPAYDARRGVVIDPPSWPAPSTRSLGWSARYALIAFALTFVAVILIGLVLRYVADVHLQVGVGVLLVDAILLAALVPLARTRGLALTDLGVRPTLALRSLGLVLLAFFTYLTLSGFWAVAFISNSTGRAANILSAVHHVGPFEIVLTVVAVSISAPIVEEIFFRGLLYRSLRNRLPVYQAALIAGLLFGLVHITGYPLITLPIKALFGVLACLLYERTGSLLPGIALHSFVDASATDISLTGNDTIVLIVTGALTGTILLRAAALKFMRMRTRAPAVPVLELSRDTLAT